MYCSNCGALATQGARFCQSCGAPLTQPNYNYAPPPQAPSLADEEKRKKLASHALFFGIAGALLSYLGISSILGIIFSIIALIKSKQYTNSYTDEPDDIKTGRMLGIIGAIWGMVMLITGIISFFIYMAWAEAQAEFFSYILEQFLMLE